MNIIIFFLILSLLVFVHELGHFLLAKKAKMGIEEFGFGFPPRILGVQKYGSKWRLFWGNKKPGNSSHTIYSINWIFAGGFVKITGENGDSEDKSSFINKSWGSRVLVVIAGVVMNLFLAFFLFWISFSAGARVATFDKADFEGRLVSESEVLVYTVANDSPAKNAGLLSGDIIKSVDDNPFYDSKDLSGYIKNNAGKVLKFNVLRNNQSVVFDVASDATPPEGRGPTGISLAVAGTVRYGVVEGFTKAALTTYNGFVSIPLGFYELFKSRAGFDALGGPVRIYQETAKISDASGLSGLLPFAALLSLNLAFLNILPIPALDGGRLLFLVIEKIRGKKNKQKFEQYANGIGFLVLIALIIAITVKDIFG